MGEGGGAAGGSRSADLKPQQETRNHEWRLNKTEEEEEVGASLWGVLQTVYRSIEGQTPVFSLTLDFELCFVCFWSATCILRHLVM